MQEVLFCELRRTWLRIIKVLARVLAVVSEVTIEAFQGPVQSHPSLLVASAIFGDGAGAMIVGSDPVLNVEKPLFEVHASLETCVPDSSNEIHGDLTQAGFLLHLSQSLATVVTENSSLILQQALEFAGSPDSNDIFWCVHPSGKRILNDLEKFHALRPENLEVSRTTLRDYGNMLGAGIIFVLDELRKKAKEQNLPTTGDGCEWGLFVAVGPGVAMEVSLLRALPT
ncbi:unnamed protein product [Calypogeia fissa]